MSEERQRVVSTDTLSADFHKAILEGGLGGVTKLGPFGIRFRVLEELDGRAKVSCEVVDAKGVQMRLLHEGGWIYIGGEGFVIENVEDCFKLNAG